MLRCNTILGNSGPGLYLRINVAFQFPGQEKEPWGQVICGVQPPHWACVSRNFNKLTKSNWLTICSLNMRIIMANLQFAEPQKTFSCLFLCLVPKYFLALWGTRSILCCRGWQFSAQWLRSWKTRFSPLVDKWSCYHQTTQNPTLYLALVLYNLFCATKLMFSVQ